MKRITQHGFFLIEVVVAASVITAVLLLLLGAIQNSVEASQRSLERTQVSYLLEEGAEAVRAIRDNNWNTISSLTTNTTYYLSWSGSAWSITTSPNTIDAFTRTVVFSPVSRDVNQDIVSTGGTDDPGTKKVVLTVTWNSQSGPKSETLSFYIANI